MAYGDGEGDGDGGGGGSSICQIVVHVANAEFPHAILVFDGVDVSLLLPPGKRAREILALLFEAAAKDVRGTIQSDLDRNQLTLKDILTKRHKESRKDET